MTWSPAGTTSWIYRILQLHQESITQGGTAAGPVLAIAGSSRVTLFISGLPCVSLQRVPGFWEHAGGEAATQAPSFPLHVAFLSLLLMGPHSEVRSSRINLCLRSYFHLTNNFGLLQAKTHPWLPPFSCLLPPPSKFRRTGQEDTIWEWNNPQTYSLNREDFGS